MFGSPIYFDNHATTRVDPRVLDAMLPYFGETFGNAASRHEFGRAAREAVEDSRAKLAAAIGARPKEIIFTSGATESNNLALLGLVRYGLESGRRHVLSTAIEHKAVLEPLDEMRRLGFEVELAPVTRGGYVQPETIAGLLRPDTLLVSVMHANNETGVLQPIEEIGELLAGGETFFHTDAAQTFGKEVVSLQAAKWDFASVSGHKIYGPKGIGALAVRSRWSPAFRRNASEKPPKGGTPARDMPPKGRTPARDMPPKGGTPARGYRSPLSPLLFGGGQERGLRPGTLPVPLVVGLGKAAELALGEHAARRRGAEAVKAKLLADLRAVPHTINGDPARTQPHVINISFPGVDSEALMLALRDEMAISNGSACTSAAYKPSHVLKAMGVDDLLLESAVRISWGAAVAGIASGPLISAVRAIRFASLETRAPLLSHLAKARVPSAV
jgi:cysteine desulfurase